MQDSAIVIALKKFKRDYSWDKSLINPAGISAPPRSISKQEDFNPLERFVNEFNTRKNNSI